MSRLPPAIQSRINIGAWALVVLVLIDVLNNRLAGTLTVKPFLPSVPFLPNVTAFTLWRAVVLVLLVVALIFWAVDDRRRLHYAVSIINTVFTIQLFAATILLVVRLAQHASVTVPILIRDAGIIFTTNILIFTLWYWLIDSATTGFFLVTAEPAWDFLFPQRAAELPGYSDWSPKFFDYLFLAFTTSVAFSPTDTPPLSRAAKLLMMTESAIALIAITVVVGTAINLLANSA